MRLEDRLDRTTAFRWGAQSGRGRLRVAHIPTQGAGMYAPPANGTLYWRDQWGRVLAESDLSGNQLYVYVYFAGRMLSRVSSTEYLAYADALGSTRTMTDATGHLCYDADFYPFGGERAYTSTCGQNYKFAGMERDPETGDDHTLFRQYASNYGRWLSPDPADSKAADPTNPQSWNRYTYALNNPVNIVDPRGLDGCALYDENGDCAVAQGSGPGPGLNNQATPPNMGALQTAAAEAQYGTNNCINCVTAFGQTFSSLNAYFDWATSPDGVNALADYHAYKEFLDEFPFLWDADPFATYTVHGQRRGATVNYQGNGLWLNLYAVMAANPDFDTSGHGGNPSWRIGGAWQLHTLDVYNLYAGGMWYGAEWHEEFASWNPGHWLDWAISKIPVLGTGSYQSFSCSLSGGCSH
jgi:RHS repeat-associated protein